MSLGKPLSTDNTLFHLFRRHSPRRRFRVDPEGTHQYADRPMPAGPPSYPYAFYLATAGTFRWLVFDLDAHAGADVVTEDLARLRALLDQAAITHLVARSGPAGGHHVWAAFPQGAAASLVRQVAYGLAAILPSLDVSPLANPATGCARPPGAPHRHGGRAELVHPADPAAAEHILSQGNPAERLQLLLDTLPPAARDTAIAAAKPAARAQHLQILDDPQTGPRLAGPRRALTPGSDKLLLHAPADASASLWAIALRCVFARFTRDDFAALAADPATTGLEHLRTHNGPRGRIQRSAGERDAILARQWDKAVQYAAQMPVRARDDAEATDPRVLAVTAAVAALEAAARAHPWRWATAAGPADREALRALSLLALACCSLTVSLDCRRWSAMTGFGKSTMADAGRRLATQHPIDGPAWIAVDTPGDGSAATTWRLPDHPPLPVPAPPAASETAAHIASVDKARTQGRQPTPPTSMSYHPTRKTVLGRSRENLESLLQEELDTASHDTWTPLGGLGHTRQRTYAAVKDGDTSLAEVMETTGYTSRTVRRHLHVLRRHDLIIIDSRGRITLGRASLDDTARKLGVHGTSARRQRAHATDRELHAWWNDEQTWRTTVGKPNQRRRTPLLPGQRAIPTRTGPRSTYGPFPTRKTPAGPGRADYAEARRRVQAHAAGEPITLPQPPRATIPSPRRPAPRPTAFAEPAAQQLRDLGHQQAIDALQLAFDLELIPA